MRPRNRWVFLRNLRNCGEEVPHAAMKEHGGFDHNAQTLRILTKLEARYACFNGLTLAWETLEGAVQHNGPLLKPGRHFVRRGNGSVWNPRALAATLCPSRARGTIWAWPAPFHTPSPGLTLRRAALTRKASAHRRKR
jgi:hypothetical protein